MPADRDALGRFKFVKVGAWKKFRVMLDPKKFDAALKKNIRRATEINALLVVKAIRKKINENSYIANAPLTVLLKGSSKPLIGAGDAELFKSITHEMVNDTTAFVGVLRSAIGADGKEMVDVAGAIHEGIEIAVTSKMRGLFLVLHKVSTGEWPESKLEKRAKVLYDQLKKRGIIKPLKPGTTHIKLPPRPFIRDVFEDKALQKKIQDNWKMAVEKSFKQG